MVNDANPKKMLENMSRLSKMREIRRASGPVYGSIGGSQMEHLRTIIATLVGLVVVLGLMAILLMSSNAKSPLCRAELCGDLVPCDIGCQKSPGPDAGKAPTLAPPRLNTLSTADNSLRTPLLGQSVYVQVKTDRVDIEVGWASADFVGR
jgi:hypothetical protein